MGALQRFERRVESLVNGVFARAFKSEVQPVEIAAALQREADDKSQALSRERVMVPNSYVVELGKRDFDRFTPWSEPLRGELAAMVGEHVSAQGYTPTGEIGVVFEHHDDLDTGMFRVRSSADASLHPSVAPAAAPVAQPAYQYEQPPYRPEPRYEPERPPARRSEPVRSAERAPDRTAVFASAPPPTAEIWLEVDGERRPLRDGVTVVGRGSEADIRLEDPGVSRRHVQIQVAGEHARLVDLGSTNGTLVHGQRVRDMALRDGDSFVLGRSTVVFRHGHPDDGHDDHGHFVPGLR